MSRVRTARSAAESSPLSDSFSPPRPLRFPWQAPALHPARDSTAITSRSNDTSAALASVVCARRIVSAAKNRSDIRWASATPTLPEQQRRGEKIGEEKEKCDEVEADAAFPPFL